MSLVRTTLLASILIMSSACAANKAPTTAPEEATIPEPTVITQLPPEIETFDYMGFKPFSSGADGYSIRYSNVRKKRIADVYVYPVDKKNLEVPHDQLVLGSTRATIQAIGEAVRQGVYANFQVINAGTQNRGVRTVARVQATYLRENLASYTLVYQTEHEGTLLKIRVSMPDNESNRSSTEWDTFAEQMFALIIRDIDEHSSPDTALDGSLANLD